MLINDIPDSVLPGMIRTGCYAKNTLLGPPSDEKAAQYLLVLAVPYGTADNVDTSPAQAAAWLILNGKEIPEELASIAAEEEL